MSQIFLIAAGGIFVVLWALAAGVLLARGTGLPLAIRLTTGAVPVSTSVFAVLAAHAGYLPVWLALGITTIAAAAWRVSKSRLTLLNSTTLKFTELPPMSWWFRALFACYGLVYLIYVFAPEIEADAITYHLGLVYEYVRLHSFSSRLGFYELLPQGVEMLFVPAFAIGAHSAAKLVHFSFLAATLSLIRYICLELKVPDSKACCAAAIFFIAPVTAIASTSAYTDAALACCCCALLYLAIRWDRERDRGTLILAALNAGFCYAVKPTFGWAALVALGFFAAKSKRKVLAASWFAAAAAVGFLPWIVRSLVLTRNPFAPFLNTWIPNGSFTPRLEAILLRSFSAFRPSFSWRTAILDYTVLGGNQGMFGPAFLLLPLAVIALRTKPGRWLVASAVLFAIPVLTNTGTRFLMPSAAIGMIALVSALPAPAAVALVAIQMIGSANPVIDLYDTRHDWRLREIPWRAALGLEKEQDYLRRKIGDFGNTAMIADLTPAGARVFALASVQQAWVAREVLMYWQSALADRVVDLLAWALDSRGTQASLMSWHWAPGKYRSIRMTPGSALRILEIQFEPGGLAPNPSKARGIVWMPWDVGQAFDFPAPAGATGMDMLVWPGTAAGIRTQAEAAKGEWSPLENTAGTTTLPVDMRRDVTAFIRRAGYQYILISAEKGSFSLIGKDMLDHPAEWALRPAAHNDDVWLFYISV